MCQNTFCSGTTCNGIDNDLLMIFVLLSNFTKKFKVLNIVFLYIESFFNQMSFLIQLSSDSLISTMVLEVLKRIEWSHVHQIWAIILFFLREKVQIISVVVETLLYRKNIDVILRSSSRRYFLFCKSAITYTFSYYITYP